MKEVEILKNILSYVEEACRNYPHNIALADECSSMTYTELLVNVRRIGSYLAKKLNTNQPIAVYMDKTPACVNAFLGVVASGNFYVVLDVSMPVERINRIFETLKPAAVITDQHHIKATKNFCFNGLTLEYEAAVQSAINDSLLFDIQKNMTENDILYILYTSGSTGQPKGTVVSHRAVIAYTEWFTATFDINENTVFGSQTPFYFSMSISDLYGALRTGATFQIIPKKYFSFPMQLVEYMNRFRINTIYWVPSALSIVAGWDTFSYIKPEYLKKVLFAGEVMPNKQLNYWRKHLPGLLYANLFGPTETTDICCYYMVDRAFSNEETLPIGHPCGNCHCFIVDENGLSAEQGELYVRGPFLANGYYNNPEKTAECFVQNPLQSAFPEIVYRTGDLVRQSPSGEFIYLGRKDFQIKHMGYRIELGEIEANISAIEKIKSCACIYDTTKDKIVLIYQGRIKKQALQEEIQKRLPSYMHPNQYVSVKNMPLNANGKINRSYLANHYNIL